MKQRVMIAMALAGEPELLIADEPTTALDVTTQVEVLVSIRRAIKEHGAAVLYISHDLAIVAQMADRVMVLRYGEAVAVPYKCDVITAIIDGDARDRAKRRIVHEFLESNTVQVWINKQLEGR